MFWPPLPTQGGEGEVGGFSLAWVGNEDGVQAVPEAPETEI